MISGAQFFTIRDFCKTSDGLFESMKKVADIGYTAIQLSGVCAFDCDWMKERLAETGLKCVLTHNPAERLLSRPENVALDNKKIGCKYVGLGFFGFRGDMPDQPRAFAEQYTLPARVIKDSGCLFMYHNHDAEFIKYGGKPILTLLAELMPEELMGFTLDTYWVQVGGGDPADWIRRLSGRVWCVHLKDAGYKQQMLPLGEGNLNFDGILSACEDAGTEYLLVEQDDCNGKDPFECLKTSFEYLKSRGIN